MKKNPVKFIAIIVIILFVSCSKDSDDNSFFIEASINGVKWRGESNSNYLASKGDGSKMKIYIGSTNPETGNFTFLSNASLLPSSYTNANFTMQKFVLGAFDSRMQLKWETTVENNIDKFEIERTTDQSNFQTIGSVSASGTSTTLKQYSFADDNINMDQASLRTLKYRVKIIAASGMVFYTDARIPELTVDKAQIAYQTGTNKLYFALDNSQNHISITSYDPATSARRGTFSFNYKDESGNIVQVRNGKFHLKL